MNRAAAHKSNLSFLHVHTMQICKKKEKDVKIYNSDYVSLHAKSWDDESRDGYSSSLKMFHIIRYVNSLKLTAECFAAWVGFNV